jgi:hypothetical protein
LKAGSGRRWRGLTLVGEMLEVEGDPDSWAPPVSVRAKKKRERRLLGCGGPQVGAREEEVRPAGGLGGPRSRPKRELGRAVKTGRGCWAAGRWEVGGLLGLRVEKEKMARGKEE